MRRMLVSSLVAALALAAGCGKDHKDLPSPLAVSTPPTVANLVVTDVSAGSTFDYNLTWDAISNTSILRYYRVYASFDGRQFTFQDTTTSTAWPTAGPVVSPLPVVSFGVTVVTIESVEGAMVSRAPQ